MSSVGAGWSKDLLVRWAARAAVLGAAVVCLSVAGCVVSYPLLVRNFYPWPVEIFARHTTGPEATSTWWDKGTAPAGETARVDTLEGWPGGIAVRACGPNREILSEGVLSREAAFASGNPDELFLDLGPQGTGIRAQRRPWLRGWGPMALTLLLVLPLWMVAVTFLHIRLMMRRSEHAKRASALFSLTEV